MGNFNWGPISHNDIFLMCDQQRFRSACASIQSDMSICCLPIPCTDNRNCRQPENEASRETAGVHRRVLAWAVRKYVRTFFRGLASSPDRIAKLFFDSKVKLTQWAHEVKMTAQCCQCDIVDLFFTSTVNTSGHVGTVS